jgi:putative NADPH-quinone reductase
MATVMLLLAHPRTTSYCHALAERIGERLLNQGHEVRSHDLYAELFDPVLTAEESHTSGETIEEVLARENDPMVALHREELRVAEGLVVVHPNWWGMPPAILTGWINRVVVPGVAYRLADATPRAAGPRRRAVRRQHLRHDGRAGARALQGSARLDLGALCRALPRRTAGHAPRAPPRDRRDS